MGKTRQDLLPAPTPAHLFWFTGQSKLFAASGPLHMLFKTDPSPH